jgi:hypothetical protein
MCTGETKVVQCLYYWLNVTAEGSVQQDTAAAPGGAGVQCQAVMSPFLSQCVKMACMSTNLETQQDFDQLYLDYHQEAAGSAHNTWRDLGEEGNFSSCFECVFLHYSK